MIIRFTKKPSGRHVFACVRDDGSHTWMHEDDWFVRHDLVHYAVETT